LKLESMDSIAQCLFWFCLVAIVYPNTFYPLSLVAIRWILRLGREQADRPPVNDLDAPRAVLLISAHNEDQVIGEKLQNALSIDYPPDKLSVLVVSDASDDGTDDIVRTFPDVALVRSAERIGKSAGINLALPELEQEMVVFSDANSSYESDALRYLMTHFQNPKVGYVMGAQKYRWVTRSPAERSETTYSEFEAWIKRLESDVSSTVGGDGAILAMRRSLISKLHPADVSDLRLPLLAVANGYRGMYEDRSCCYEASRETFRGQFDRKVRIIHRSIWSVLRTPEVLNPFQMGVFSYQVICHKLLRWLSPMFLIGMVAALAWLAFRGSPIYTLLLWMVASFCLLASLYAIPPMRGVRWVYLPFYFFMVQCAAMLAILQLYRPNSYTIWDTGRGARDGNFKASSRSE
jgi:cellulose synthase/poly-beta-1,6-N-acetylglucosamine synthase-like glycosyltransferase